MTSSCRCLVPVGTRANQLCDDKLPAVNAVHARVLACLYECMLVYLHLHVCALSRALRALTRRPCHGVLVFWRSCRTFACLEKCQDLKIRSDVPCANVNHNGILLVDCC